MEEYAAEFRKWLQLFGPTEGKSTGLVTNTRKVGETANCKTSSKKREPKLFISAALQLYYELELDPKPNINGDKPPLTNSALALLADVSAGAVSNFFKTWPEKDGGMKAYKTLCLDPSRLAVALAKLTHVSTLRLLENAEEHVDRLRKQLEDND